LSFGFRNFRKPRKIIRQDLSYIDGNFLEMSVPRFSETTGDTGHEGTGDLHWVELISCSQPGELRLSRALLRRFQVPAFEPIYHFDHQLAKFIRSVIDHADTEVR